MNTAIVEHATDLLTPEQTAKLLGLKRGTLSVWRCNGRFDLPFVKCGRLVRYKRSAVEAWLESRTATSCAQLVASA